MNILIVHAQSYDIPRSTVQDHLRCLERHTAHHITYLNVFLGAPPAGFFASFDAVVIHYTFFALRWLNDKEFAVYLDYLAPLTTTECIKIAVPQDEYFKSNVLCHIFKTFGINYVMTCFSVADWHKAYPENLCGDIKLKTILPGYLPEPQGKSLPNSKMTERLIDIGYRARHLPASLGRLAQFKHLVAEQIKNSSYFNNFRLDISTNIADSKLGGDWYTFLRSCRTVLGCESGASILDPDGKISRCVDRERKSAGDSSFANLEKKCFAHRDGEIDLACISPRHFEAILAGTCQVLVRGHYSGLLKADVHYIPIEKDFSNLQEVAEKVADQRLTSQIAENAYRDIVMTKRFGYDVLANTIVDFCGLFQDTPTKRTYLSPLAHQVASHPVKNLIFCFKKYLYRAFYKANLIPYLKTIRK